jgi:hypothetical protein
VRFRALFPNNPKSLSGYEPTAVRGKWFEVNDLNHSATDAPVNVRDLVELTKDYAKTTETNEFIALDYTNVAESRAIQAEI